MEQVRAQLRMALDQRKFAVMEQLGGAGLLLIDIRYRGEDAVRGNLRRTSMDVSAVGSYKDLTAALELGRAAAVRMETLALDRQRPENRLIEVKMKLSMLERRDEPGAHGHGGRVAGGLRCRGHRAGGQRRYLSVAKLGLAVARDAGSQDGGQDADVDAASAAAQRSGPPRRRTPSPRRCSPVGEWREAGSGSWCCGRGSPVFAVPALRRAIRCGPAARPGTGIA